ncbi:MAG: hypothetical protein ABSF14_20400 [Terriglobia bacterium]|jgi:hypothetical protein
MSDQGHPTFEEVHKIIDHALAGEDASLRERALAFLVRNKFGTASEIVDAARQFVAFIEETKRGEE